MCTLPPEWEIPADLQPRPIVFRQACFNKPQYKLTSYNNAHSQPEEWNSEQESQDSDNDGDMFSLPGSSPADSNNHDQLENDELRRSETRPLFGEITSISDLESHHSYWEGGGVAHHSALEHRFASYRPILVCNSSGWHALAFSYFEIFTHPQSQIQVDEEIARISSLDNLLNTAGQYELRLIKHMIKETINLLKDLSNFKALSQKTASDFLLHRFNDPAVCSNIICHFRLIASSWLAAKSLFYEAYIPEGFGINTYRNRWLNAPQQEIDPLGMTLLVDVLLRPLRVGLEVTSIGENQTATHCTYPNVSIDLNDNDLSTKTTTIHLLHRNNHYDILYEDVHAGEEEGRNNASDVLPQAIPQATKAESDAYSFEESYQIPETRFLRYLTTFTPQETNVLPHLVNLRLSESGVDSILGINDRSCVLNVSTAVNPKTFVPENAPLTGLGDIAAFAKDKEREEATLRAQRSRLKETEPKALSRPLSSSKSPLACGSILPLGCATEIEHSLLKHAEHIPPIMEPPTFLAADPKQVTNSLVEESLGLQNELGTDYETDWEEEEEETHDEDGAEAFFEHGSILTWSSLRDRGSLKSFLAKLKDGLVECLMKEFWDMANQTPTSTTRMHGSPADSSNPSSENNGSLRQQLQNFTPGKRSREDGNDEPPERDEERGSKKPKSVLTPLESSDERLQFACPYRKHDPRKYNVNQWATCALTAREGVARVKSHLYSKHRIHQCPRCKGIFPTQEELDRHVVALEGCDVRASNPEQPVEGITDRLKEQLQCRKKSYPGQTEAERWQQVYQLLFPNEIVPNPYFEPVRDLEDDESQVSDSVRLEQHLRREVPRRFRILLENELQFLEERLKSRILSLVQEAHNHALTNYQSPSQLALGALPTSPFVEPQRSSIEPSSTPNQDSTPESIFGPIFQPGPGGVDVEGQLGGSDGVMNPKSPQHHSSFDSGYYTDSWGTEYSQQTTVDLPTDTSLVGEPARPGGVENSIQLQKTGTGDSLHDEVWPFYPGIMTTDNSLNFHAFATWSPQRM